jgi:hypothetical protein
MDRVSRRIRARAHSIEACGRNTESAVKTFHEIKHFRDDCIIIFIKILCLNCAAKEAAQSCTIIY